MADSEQITEAEEAIVSDIVNGVRRYSHDGTSIEAEDLGDRLDALDRLRRDESATHVHRGLRFTRLRPPGCG